MSLLFLVGVHARDVRTRFVPPSSIRRRARRINP
jgi:hypothetical protein